LKVGLWLPYRLYVAVALVAATCVLYRYNRILLGKLACYIVPCVLSWAYLRNESVRYTALASPYFAILSAGAAPTLWKIIPTRRTIVCCITILVLTLQITSNYALLYLYRKADYVDVSTQLHRAIPPGGAIYGSLIFWMAFNDHTFFAYNRTPLEYALKH